MSSRKSDYVFCVIVLVVVVSLPQLFAAAFLAWEGYSRGQWPLPTFPTFGQKSYSNPLRPLPFWRDKFVHVVQHEKTANGVGDYQIWLIDPETGETDVMKPVLSGGNVFEEVIFGDRIWFIGNSDAFELADGDVRKSDFATPGSHLKDGQRFLWEGRPTYIHRSERGFIVSTHHDGVWKPVGIVAKTDPAEMWVIEKYGIHFDKRSSIQVCTSNEEVHLFLHARGDLLHRKGLEIEPFPTAVNDSKDAPVKVERDLGTPTQPQRKRAYVDAAFTGWSVIDPKTVSSMKYSAGLLIEGQPAALIVDEPTRGKRVGHLFRPEGTGWHEFASLRLPIQTSFATVTTHDGRRSYLGVITFDGNSSVYALESTGFRKTKGVAAVRRTQDWATQMKDTISFYIGILAATLALGMLLGALTWITMNWFTKPEYQFGLQSVKLASLGRRGVARLIDLTLVVIATVGVGRLMSHNVDWLAFSESLNLQVDHPMIPLAARSANVLAVWIVVVLLAMISTQAVWGITPGKWVCQLRTVRTNLRRCGFARSLAREIVFFVDCCNLLCWTPGILSIALTEKRQRLGDLVADTIIIESPSMPPIRTL